ncbi:MAG: hypothetical protein LBH48_05955, partial [Bifidobacteriaceae bacterium]|nr:hypothetical protein [Bifidobacteriaceae bacterium]
MKLFDGLRKIARQIEDGEAARAVAAARRMVILLYSAYLNGLPGDLQLGTDIVGDALIPLLPRGAWAGDTKPTLA